GGADDPLPSPGDDEQHGLLGAQDEPGVRADAIPGHHQVDALRRAHPTSTALTGQAQGLLGPHPGGVDDPLRSDADAFSGLHVGDLGPDDPSGLFEESDDTGAVGHVGPVSGGGAGDEQGVTSVVDLGVVVLQSADQGVLAERRRDRAGTTPGQVPVARYASGLSGEHAERVVQRDAGTGVEPFPHAVFEWVDERYRPDQVRRELLDEQSTFPKSLGDESEVQHLQVAKAAVDEFGAATRRPGREVLGLDEADAQTAGDGVEGGSTPHDATTDDEYVELLACHVL